MEKIVTKRVNLETVSKKQSYSEVSRVKNPIVNEIYSLVNNGSCVNLVVCKI
jgi:hypothetical protein